MIYFDNAATGGRKPSGVLRAVQASLAGICGNPGRSGHALSVALAGQVYECRENLRRFFGAESAERVILTKNCTEALNIAIFGLINAQTYAKKPHIVSTVAEHNSVLRPLFFLERQGKIELTLAPLTDGKVLPESIAGAVKENTLACVFTLASNVTGAAIDPAAVRALLPARVYTVCDGAQACGHIPVDMRAAGIDALCLAGHKGMHGIQGSGALLFSERLELAPYMFGGTGSESFNPAMPDFYPDKLEAGGKKGVRDDGAARRRAAKNKERARLFAAEPVRHRGVFLHEAAIGIFCTGAFGRLPHRRARRAALRPEDARRARLGAGRVGAREPFGVQLPRRSADVFKGCAGDRGTILISRATYSRSRPRRHFGGKTAGRPSERKGAPQAKRNVTFF